MLGGDKPWIFPIITVMSIGSKSSRAHGRRVKLDQRAQQQDLCISYDLPVTQKAYTGVLYYARGRNGGDERLQVVWEQMLLKAATLEAGAVLLSSSHGPDTPYQIRELTKPGRSFRNRPYSPAREWALIPSVPNQQGQWASARRVCASGASRLDVPSTPRNQLVLTSA